MMLFFPKYNKWGPTIIYYTLTCALRAHVNSTQNKNRRKTQFENRVTKNEGEKKVTTPFKY